MVSKFLVHITRQAKEDKREALDRINFISKMTINMTIKLDYEKHSIKKEAINEICQRC